MKYTIREELEERIRELASKMGLKTGFHLRLDSDEKYGRRIRVVIRGRNEEDISFTDFYNSDKVLLQAVTDMITILDWKKYGTPYVIKNKSESI